MDKTPMHFKGKKPAAHLKEARQKGQEASEETHGVELPGHLFAATDAAKELAVVLGGFWIIFSHFDLLLPHWIMILITFSFLYIIWKTGRSGILGWSRLERLHRLIEEERWEIEHHRPQEKEELTAMYASKGFTGRLLDEVIEVLMADDNRLLQVMLEEELNLSFESYEHPLKQALGAFIGSSLAAICMIGSIFYFATYGMIVSAIAIVIISATIAAKREKNKVSYSIIWNLALLILTFCLTYFLINII